MPLSVFTWTGKAFGRSEGQSFPEFTLTGRWLAMPVPLNCHAHLLDALIPGTPPKDLRKAVVGGRSHKHAGITRLLKEIDASDFKKRFAAIHPTFPGSAVEFREGGLAGIRLGKLGPSHLILGRPREGEWDAVAEAADGIAVSGVNDHPRRYVEACREAARRARKPFALHASESVREDMDSILSLEPDFLIHLCKATRSDMLKVADAGIPVVVCPRGTAFFGGKVPLRRMLDAGVRVTIGTDNAMISAPHPYMEVAELIRSYRLAERDAVNLVNAGWNAFEDILHIGDDARKLYWRLEGRESCKSALSRPPDRIG